MGDMNDGNDKNKGGAPGPFDFKKNKMAFFIFAVVVSFLLIIVFANDNTTSKELSYSTFLTYVQENRISEVSIWDEYEIQGFIDQGDSKTGEAFTTKIPYADPKLVETLKAKKVNIKGGIRAAGPLKILAEFLPWTILIVFIWLMYRQVQNGNKGAFGFGKSRAKKYDDKGKPVTFADVAGQEEAKYELQEVVEFLKNPDKFTTLGAKIPKGVLLVGMPGTGKTLLAKAVAGEAGVNFSHMSGSDFVEMFVGVGASRVRDLFETGRKNAPCILFIDEIDAVGRTRGAGYGGGHDEREQTLNQLLVEMDGFDTKEGVIIIAATNRPDVLDPALLRPGRFDRQVVVDMPDIRERHAILSIHAKKTKLAPDVDLLRLAKVTPGSSGADLANLINEAALFAGRKGKEAVDMDDLEESRDKILMGVARKSKIMTQKERLATSFHEAGHALLHYYLKDSDSLHKVTIIPRGRALGVAFSLPEGDKYSYTQGYMMDRIKICYGGYVAEEMIYGETTTGTASDIKNATAIARKMVTELGMSKKIGPMALGSEGEPIFIGKEIASHKDYSEDTARSVDEEIRRILNSCLDEVRQILQDHRAELEKLANELLIKETLDDTDVRVLLGLPEKAVDKA